MANPMLLHAATEVFEDWEFEFDEPGWRGSRYETGWYVDPAEPDIRRRARVSLDAELGDDPVSVYVDMQRNRYGIWVEVPGDRELENETADDLEERIVRRARELAR